MSELNFKRIDANNWYMTVKLPDEMISYLWSCVHDAEKDNIDHRSELAGNISRSLTMKDEKNLIIGSVFESLYSSNLQPVFRREIEKCFRTAHSPSKSFNKGADPKLTSFWVNFQKKYEYNPLHNHSGIFSFVIWMKIPYDIKKEQELPWVKGSKNQKTVGNFTFVGPDMENHILTMEKEIEGYCAIFPSHLHHMVYPFYTSDEERVSISGNIYYELEQ